MHERLLIHSTLTTKCGPSTSYTCPCRLAPNLRPGLLDVPLEVVVALAPGGVPGRRGVAPAPRVVVAAAHGELDQVLSFHLQAPRHGGGPIGGERFNSWVVTSKLS